MANKTTSMSKVRQILKLYSQGIGKKKIGARLSMSKNTVKLYIDKYIELRIPLDELMKFSDYELDKRFHPPYETIVNSRINQLYEYYPQMEKELRKRGVTVAKLFRKFKEENPDALAETSFYHYYRLWKKRVNVSLHVEHKAGDKMYIDYAGATLPYVDEDTGEIMDAQVYVAVLGWSQYAYIEALPSQMVEDLILGTENALHFFEGVPLSIVPDNLKSAVIKSSRYEPVINENFKSFADHYGTTVLPARVRKPKDKALVENMVKLTYQNIYSNLPDKKICTLAELNAEIRKYLYALNRLPLTGKDCSREQQWQMEKNMLQSLPDTRYEMRKIKQVTVMKNGHVYLTEDQHYYSVPYELIGRKLNMQYARSTVEIFYKYQLVAHHKRVRSRHQYSTDASHIPPQHRFVTEWSSEFFIEKGRQIDPAVEYYITQVLAAKRYPTQAYRSCNGILSFAARVGKERLITACKMAHGFGYYNYRTIEDILNRNLDKYEQEEEGKDLPQHENIRGRNYYE
jgi:transposase